MSESTELAHVGDRRNDLAEPPEDAGEWEMARWAAANGASVETVERMMDLQDRHEKKIARGAFFAATNAFQEEVPEITKSRKASITTKSGANYGYTYAPLEEITRTIRPVLRKHGLSYSWDVEQENPGTLKVICVLRHVDGHEERASFPVPVETSAAMSGAQKNGAALTYGRRQSLIAVLGLTTADEDVDGAPPPREVETITEQQAADLKSLAEEVEADMPKLLRHLRVKSLGDLPASRYQRAVRDLETRRETLAAKRAKAEGEG